MKESQMRWSWTFDRCLSSVTVCVCLCVCIQTSSWSVFIVHNALYSCWAMSIVYARLAQILEPTDPQLNLRQNFTKAFKCTAICIMSSVVTEALFVKWFTDRHKKKMSYAGTKLWEEISYIFIYICIPELKQLLKYSVRLLREDHSTIFNCFF